MPIFKLGVNKFAFPKKTLKMSDNNFTADRIRLILEPKNLPLKEKKMFGGWCFMVNDKMCIGTYKGGIMARIDPGELEELIRHNGAFQMVHGGRPMKGYIMLEPEAYDSDEDLEFWVGKCLEFNPKAKSSKKKK